MSPTPSVAQSGDPASERRFALLVTLAFACALAVSMWRHEPWRDEMLKWLVARDSDSVTSLLANLRYEGHPPFWYALLIPFTRLGGPWLVYPVNAVFAVGGVLLFSRYAPFERASRALFAFGLMPFYEWGTLARNYACGFFFLAAFGALFPRRARHPLLAPLLLALAAFTSAHAAMVAAGGLLLLFLDRIFVSRADGDPQAAQAPAPLFWAGLVLGGVGFLLAAWSMIPPADCAIGPIWAAHSRLERLGKMFQSLVDGFAPVPWPHPFKDWPLLPARVLQVAVGILVMLAFTLSAGLALTRRRAVWTLYLAPLLVMLWLFYARYYGGSRHSGFLFLAALLALWLAPLFPERPEGTGRIARWQAAAALRMPRILKVTLAFHVFAMAIPAGLDLVYVYSAGRATAQLIRERGLGKGMMIADPDWSTTNVVALTNVPGALYANVKLPGSFPVQDSRHGANGRYTRSVSDDWAFEQAATFASKGEHRWESVIVLDHEADPKAAARAHAEFVGSRRADIVIDESFWVYRVPIRTAADAPPVEPRR